MSDATSTRLELIAQFAMRIARRCVTPYACPKSRHDFTQPQLLACLVLKVATRNDYRGVCELLTIAPTLQAALGLRRIPHWTTLQKFMAKPQVPQIIDAMIGEVLKEVGAADQPRPIAVDSTGLQNGMASLHYHTRRWGRGVARKSIKVSLAVVCNLMLPVAMVVSVGAGADMQQMPELMAKIEGRTKPSWVLADAGYDAEWVHEHCRHHLGAQTAIPAVPRGPGGVVKTKWRSMMKTLPTIYGVRWHAESFFSGMKRTTLATLSSRTESTLLHEASMKVLTYAIRR